MANEPQARQHIPAALEFLASATLIQVAPELTGPHLPPRIRAHYAPAGRDIVSRIIAETHPALAHVEGYFLRHYLPTTPRLPTVLLEENIEFALEQSGEPFGFYPTGASVVTRDWEVEAWRQADCCVAVTKEDAEIMRLLADKSQVACVTNGMDHLDLTSLCRTASSEVDRTFLYVANYGWQPSLDAARHLVQDIWPLVRAISPDLRLLLAGTGMDCEFEREAALQENVTVGGPYPAFADVARRASAFLYPLRFGGGLKVKLIEAISAGLPVVTTDCALRGFPPELRRFISVAETSQAFADSAVAALRRDDRVDRAEAARAILEQSLPTWEGAAAQLGDVWSTVSGLRNSR